MSFSFNEWVFHSSEWVFHSSEWVFHSVNEFFIQVNEFFIQWMSFSFNLPCYRQSYSTGRNSICLRYLLVFARQRPHSQTHHKNSHKRQSTMRALANSHPSAARMQRVCILRRRMAALSKAHRLRTTTMATISASCPVGGPKEPAEQRIICCFRWHINEPILM